MAIVGRVAPGIHVYGLRETQAAFKQVDRQVPKQLKREFLDVADHVVGIAQQKMPFNTGVAAKSLKPMSTQLGAGIWRPAGGPGTGKLGHKSAQYYPWLDFGGSTGRGHIDHKAWSGAIQRPFIKRGRYLYPAIDESKDYIETQVFGAIILVAKETGFGVK